MNNYIWILLLLILFGGSGNGCNCDCGGNRPRCNDRPSGKPCGPGSGSGFPPPPDVAVPADVFSLRHSRPLSCQSVNLKMQSHRQMTVTCILYAKLQASFFHMVNNRIGQAAISG